MDDITARVAIAAAGRKIAEEDAKEKTALLDNLAGLAMGGVLSNPILFTKMYEACEVRGIDFEPHLAKYSYDLGAAMLAERARRNA